MRDRAALALIRFAAAAALGAAAVSQEGTAASPSKQACIDAKARGDTDGLIQCIPSGDGAWMLNTQTLHASACCCVAHDARRHRRCADLCYLRGVR